MGIKGKHYGFLELDMEATRRNVEERLETARIYNHLGEIRREVKTTASADPRYHGSTNVTSDSTGDVAVHNVDHDALMKAVAESVDRVVRRLPKKQQEIIQLRYLSSLDTEFDYNVSREVHLSESTYRRVKTKAIINIAFALRLEVWITLPLENVTAS